MAAPQRGSQDTFNSPTALSPATQYPFPLTDPPRRGNRGNLRRGSTTSSISSIGGALDAGPKNQNAIPEVGQNAISTLLQHPIMRTGLQTHQSVSASGFKAPTQRDIPPVALTNIPHVETKAFQPYLAQVGSLYEAFKRARNESEGESSLFQRDKGRTDSRAEEWEAALAKRQQRPGHSRANSTLSPLASPTETPQAKRRTSGHRRQAVTPLSTIPAVYSEEDFHLENPRTFDIVSEHSELVRDPKAAPSGRKSLATNAILQEKLSWYMDTVEVHLISSISTASKSFFSALGSLRELHGEAADSIDRIQKLRKELARLDKEMAIDGLKVVNLKQRRDNVRKLAEAIMQLEDVVTSVQQCEDMVERGDIDDAMDDLDEIERLIAGKSSYCMDDKARKYEQRDLRPIKALHGAFDEINRLKFRIGRGFEGRFHKSLLDDIRFHVQKTETLATLERWGIAFTRLKPGQRRKPSKFPGYMNFGPELRAELESEMKGLTRARYSTPAATAFRALVLREMKSMIRKQLPSSNDDDTMSTMSASTAGGARLSQAEKSSILARNLRSLDPEDWYKMLASIYTNTSEALRRLSVQVKILLDITSTLPDANVKSPPRTPDPGSIDSVTTPQQRQGRPRAQSSVQAEMQQALDLSSLLGEGVDLIQNQLTKVVKVRSQQNSELPLNDFLKYFTLNRLFADECEAISGRSGTGLKVVLDTQIKEFVARFGDSVKQRLMERLDADKWDAKDFGDSEIGLLDRVKQGSVEDCPSWTEAATIWQPSQGISSINGNASNGISPPKDKVRSAVIDDNKFILPDSGAAILSALESLEHLAAGIPSMSGEVASHVLDTLRLFNSRSSQLILGAGATRSAGLKNITTKHLALSSQALAFIMALVPYIREFFRRHLPAASLQNTLNDFENVRRRVTEHQAALYEKLIDIMSGRASVHVKSMKAINWDQTSASKTLPVSPYMETLVKETATLQKVLAKHLPENVVMSIMGPVFQSYRNLWEQAYQNVEVRSERGKERYVALHLAISCKH